MSNISRITKKRQVVLSQVLILPGGEEKVLNSIVDGTHI